MVAKFRKKPVIVEALQWFSSVPHPGVVGADPNALCGCVVFHGNLAHQPHLHTIHGGYVPVESGDWIIAEADGEHFYPCKPAIFEMTYEPVEEA